MPPDCCPSPEIKRHGGNGRPKIALPGDGGYAYYARPSKWGDVIQDTYHLDRWDRRQVARGLAMKPELLLSVKAHIDHSDKDNKRKLNELADKAKTFAGSSDRAELGTALHKLCENFDTNPDGFGFEDLGLYEPDLHAYVSTIDQAGIQHAHIEHFMVNDQLRLGGTPDRLVWFDGKLRVLDIKTGDNDERYPEGPAIQFAIYAHCDLYDVKQETRTEVPVEMDWAIMCVLPAGTGECRLWKVDIEQGWHGALLADEVREWQKSKPYDFLTRLDVL